MNLLSGGACDTGSTDVEEGKMQTLNDNDVDEYLCLISVQTQTDNREVFWKNKVLPGDQPITLVPWNTWTLLVHCTLVQDGKTPLNPNLLNEAEDKYNGNCIIVYNEIVNI